LKIDYLPQYFQRLYNNLNIDIEHSQNILNKLTKERQSINENFRSIPENATIKEEYVKCGKEFCLTCNHGPYYYAYWKEENDSGKI
jgi:hypothetical protein